MVLGAAIAGLMVCGHFQVSYAGQIDHNVFENGHKTTFHYRWKDWAQREHAMEFSLLSNDVQRGMQEFINFDNTTMQNWIIEQLQNYAEQNYTYGNRRVTVQRANGGYELVIQGYPEHQAERVQVNLAKRQNEFMEQYLAQHFYTRVNETTLMPDHKAIAKRYVLAMSPVANAIRRNTRGMSQRQVVNYTLNFLQAIPYDELTNRYTSNGAGFQTPYGLLTTNIGDCDTKSVALAAILRNLYPSMRLMMLYVPNHAFVGLQMPQGGDDYALRLGGDVFVVADPAGPGMAPLGQTANDAINRLLGGEYSYQEIPF